MKSALVFSGPGFSDQGDLIHDLKLKGYHVFVRAVGTEEGFIEVPEIHDADLIVLRGPWLASPEEKFIVNLMGDRLSKCFQTVVDRGGFTEKQRVLGVGRGALILLYSPLLAHVRPKTLEWSPSFLRDGPWLKTEIFPEKTNILSLAMGRAIPILSENKKQHFKAWLKVRKLAVGYKLKSNIFLSFIDFLAYAERTQLANFGYEDLLEIPTQSQVVDAIVDNDFSKENLFLKHRGKISLV